MNFSCPNCTRTLAVADEFAGRRVKCPACQHVFQLPPSLAVAPGPAAERGPAAASVPPLPAKKPASSTPPRPTRPWCPECGEPLAADASDCPKCGWTSSQPVVKASRHPPATEDRPGGCYILIRNDAVNLSGAIEKRMKKLIRSEQLDVQIMGEEDLPPDELGPNDLVISGKINNCDYGSRFIRYWLTIVAIIGPGSCQLAVTADVETAERGKRRLKSRARQCIGFLGGNSDDLMKRNVQTVATRIATGAARHATGHRLLNAQTYSCANWSLGLGLLSLLPFVGVLFGLGSLVVGSVALLTINQRQLPRGKGAARAGIVLSFLGFAVSAGLMWQAAH